MFKINSLVPELWCSDFDASLEFYTGPLGFQVAQRRARDRHAYLELQGSQIMIAFWQQDGSWEPWMPQSLDRPYGRGINFQFLVSNLDEIYQSILHAGVAPFKQLETSHTWRTDRMDLRSQFMVLDPDGYLLRFSQVQSHRPVEPSDIEALDRLHGYSS